MRWGVLGVAAIATGRTMPAIAEASSATLVAVASRDASKAAGAAALHPGARAYAGYDALLADADVDAVYVPLPNALHVDWSLRALAAGKHVLCEKPLGLSAVEVEALIEMRERTGLHIEEAFGFRNHPQWARARAIVDAGTIGEVRSIHSTLAKQFLDPADTRNSVEAGGGALYDLGSYAISACNLLIGRAPARVVAAIDRDPSFGIDRLSSALLDYGERHAAFTVATQAGSSGWGTHQQLSVLGCNGWLRMTFPYAHARPTACSIEVGHADTVGAFPSERIAFEPCNQYTLQIERFSRLLLGEDVPSWPIEDALDTMRTIEALFASAQSGGWQRVG